MSEQSGKQGKKSVKAYPFSGTLDIGGAPKPVQVLYLNTLGVMVQLEPNLVFVGKQYAITFEVPVQHSFVQCPVKVIKTYDRSKSEKSIERIAELHFIGLTSEHRHVIQAFTSAIRQK